MPLLFCTVCSELVGGFGPNLHRYNIVSMLTEVFKAKTQDSELSQTSSVEVRWTSLKDKLLQATKQVCGVSSNHPWRKQTWWWNNQVEEAVREKRRCFKLWKAGGSRAAYNTAKRTSNRVVHQAKSEAEKVALQKIDARSGDIYRLAKQMRRDNQDVMGEKPVKNDEGQLRNQRKKLGKSIMSIFLTLSSLGTQKTCQRKAQLKAQASQSPWR